MAHNVKGERLYKHQDSCKQVRLCLKFLEEHQFVQYCVDKNEMKNCDGTQIWDPRRSKLLLTGLIWLVAGGSWGKNYHRKASIVYT